ncbi:ferric reductase NAD binding domain-containing protein [Trametes polyzona]|nr:ferric reductase NAD binding domain-containing protein [Trametes polyzona]
MSDFAVPTPAPTAGGLSATVVPVLTAVPEFTASPALRPIRTYTYTTDGVVETYVYVAHKPPLMQNAYWGVFALMGVATVINFAFIAWATLRRRQARTQKDSPPAPKPTGRLSLRRFPHAILSASRIWGFRLRIPFVEMTLVELALTIMYLGGCLAFTYAPTDSEKPAVHLQPNYWGAKAGLMAAGQMPLAVFLALKNNPVTYLTGLGHEKLILMHRIVSRCIFLLTWLHFVGEYYRSPALLMNEAWKVAGMVAAVAQTITTIFGIKQIRHAYYEIFYSSHVVLIIIFIVTSHVHCIPMECPEYVWPCYVIWGFDRLLRWARYSLFNFILRPKDRKAHIESIGADGLRVTLKRRIPGGWKAGQHVFLAFPALGIESHPFTIGNVYEKEEGSDEAEMVFIVRAMGGQTRMLMDRALVTGSCELNAFFDGPYGHPEDIRAFTTCVFISGGTGVTYTVARMHQLFKDVHASDARAKRVFFVWAVRTETEYEWVASDIAKVVALAPPSISLVVEVYLTGARRDTGLQALPELEKDYDIEKDATLTSSSTPARTPSRTSSGQCSNEKTASGSSTPVKSSPAYFGTTAAGITRKAGRPDIRRILEEEVTASEGAVAVDVSGPDGLVDSVRSALSKSFTGPVATMKGTPTVLLSVEQFRM